MKVPWKYKKVSTSVFDGLHYTYSERARSRFSPASYYGNGLGKDWYYSGVKPLRDIVRGPFHWTRGKLCQFLKPRQDIVDCLVEVVNGRGKTSYLVGKHYVGMCPFKNRWKLRSRVKSLVRMDGR